MSKGGNQAGALVSLLVVIIFTIVASIYALGMHSEHAQAIDINNTSSANLYNSQAEERGTTYTVLGIVPVILGISLLVWVVMTFSKK